MQSTEVIAERIRQVVRCNSIKFIRHDYAVLIVAMIGVLRIMLTLHHLMQPMENRLPYSQIVPEPTF